MERNKFKLSRRRPRTDFIDKNSNISRIEERNIVLLEQVFDSLIHFDFSEFERKIWY